jgi:SEL1 protein
MAHFLTGPPGGRTLPLTPTRLSDLVGGVYGPGASVSSTGHNIRRASVRAAESQAAGETWEDIIEYYRYHASRGDPEYEHRLAKIFYHGSLYAVSGGAASGAEGVGAVPRDYARAHAGFLRVARLLWPKDPVHEPLKHAAQAPPLKDAPPRASWGVYAAGYLGRMYLRGEGVRADAARARMWFERGAEYGDRESHNGLGLIWRDGLVDGRVDPKKAAAHFGVAAGHDLAEAQVNMGKLAAAAGNAAGALPYFEAAVRSGSPFEAYYHLGVLQHAIARAPGAPEGACPSAVAFLKTVAERGAWGGANLVRRAEEAWAAGAHEGALTLWALAAEQGHEAAQNNLAFVLDADSTLLARVWPGGAAPARWERAAGFYRAAADTHLSALAMWNLGWMYEHGRGVPRDFHLAKRYYDLALETNGEAYLPVMLALLKLYARSVWHTLNGGQDGLRLWPHDEDDDVAPPPKQDTRNIDGADDKNKRRRGAGSGSAHDDTDDAVEVTSSTCHS